ncbi:MAG: tetraacyldisaccharide 4'-kinase [Acidobacteriota bacterium]
MRPSPGLLATPISHVYELAVRLRFLAYGLGLLRRHRLSAPVISVGNLTVGGAGKTPLVARVCEDLGELGFDPAVLSRGYRGRAERSNVLVSDGREILVSPEVAGDEPYLLAQLLPGVPVAVGRRRERSARLVLERLPAASRVFVLDDGFQYLALDRDLDLVIFDAAGSLDRRLLPAGPLREPWSALRRADAACLTRCHLPNARPDEFTAAIHRITPGLPCFRFRTEYAGWIDESGKLYPPRHLHRVRATVVAGIGNPQQFLDDLARLGIRIVNEFLLPDHHRFSAAEVDRILDHARRLGSEVVITTEKDRVRLLDYLPSDPPLWTLRIRFVPEQTREWVQWLAERLPASGSAGRPETAGA